MSTARMGGRQYIVGLRMAQRAASPADVDQTRGRTWRARITIGLRSWGFYPPEHPAVGDRGRAARRRVGGSDRRRHDAARGHAAGAAGRRPAARGAPTSSVSECAELLHDRDILQITFVGAAAATRWCARCSTMLTLDRETRRARGGPAAIWAAEDQTAILIEQIDYQEILEREIDEGAGAARRHVEVDRPLDHHGPHDLHAPRSSSACSKSRATSARSASSRKDSQGAVLHAGRLAAA